MTRSTSLAVIRSQICLYQTSRFWPYLTGAHFGNFPSTVMNFLLFCVCMVAAGTRKTVHMLVFLYFSFICNCTEIKNTCCTATSLNAKRYLPRALLNIHFYSICIYIYIYLHFIKSKKWLLCQKTVTSVDIGMRTCANRQVAPVVCTH